MLNWDSTCIAEKNENIKVITDELKVWQLEIFHGRHMQIVEYCSVPVDTGINVLEHRSFECLEGGSRSNVDVESRKSRNEILYSYNLL